MSSKKKNYNQNNKPQNQNKSQGQNNKSKNQNNPSKNQPINKQNEMSKKTKPNKVVNVENKENTTKKNSKVKDNINKEITYKEEKPLIEKRADNRFINLDNKPIIKEETVKEIAKEEIITKELDKKNKKISKIIIVLLLVIVLLIMIALAFLGYLSNLKPFKDVTLELGNSHITKEDFINKGFDTEDVKLMTELKTIDFSKVGEYKINLSYKGITSTVKLIIEDTIEPTLELQDKEIYLNEKVSKEDFIVTALDLSGDVTTTLDSEIDYQKVGKQTIKITCKDKNGNAITKEAILTIKKDTTAPTFQGLTALTVKKNAKINYTSGVKAIDDLDGQVEFTYDASKVNTSKSGTYYVTYSASDKSGNKASAKRKITVDHDESDTMALVTQIASTLSSDPEELRDYCRNKIRYDHNDGGDDPLYYGLTNHKGNCYVHAMCFQALLNAKGIENQLIWVTNKTHYWNLVKINGVWRHMDSTPDRNHRKISIMTDEQRLSTLSGRKWDFSAWPSAK